MVVARQLHSDVEIRPSSFIPRFAIPRHHVMQLAAQELAPSPSAFNFPQATSRDSGTIPQFVHGKSFTGSTCSIAARIVAATCSGFLPIGCDVYGADHHVLPFSRPRNSSGTLEFAHSSETWPIFDLASRGRWLHACRHCEPSVFFQSMLALMP